MLMKLNVIVATHETQKADGFAPLAVHTAHIDLTSGKATQNDLPQTILNILSLQVYLLAPTYVPLHRLNFFMAKGKTFYHKELSSTKA